jgi:hypothetical protein
MGLDIEVEHDWDCPFRAVHPNSTDSLRTPGTHERCGAMDEDPCLGLDHEDCPVNKYPDGVWVKRVR